ncbi:MAG TPA: hypothetical protein VIL99_10580 [Ignavibacteria bacterium]
MKPLESIASNTLSLLIKLLLKRAAVIFEIAVLFSLLFVPMARILYVRCSDSNSSISRKEYLYTKPRSETNKPGIFILCNTEIKEGNDEVEINIIIIPTERNDFREIKKNHSGFLNNDADNAMIKAGTETIKLREKKYCSGSFERKRIIISINP